MKKLIIALTFLLAIGIFAPMPLEANEISVAIDGEQMDFDGMQMVVVDYRALLPVRDIFEHLEFDVAWEHETRTVHLSRYPEFAISITIGDDAFVNNGVEYPLDVPAQIIDGRTLLPIRAVLESAGYYVVWDVDGYAVFITSAPPEYIIMFGRQYSTSLTYLYFSWIDNTPLIAPEEVAQLRYMTNLTHLDLSGNQIHDITPLAGLTSLRHLYVGMNQITDITPLVGLRNLTSLSIADNNINDIRPLARLTNMARLSISGNQISDITPLAGLTYLVSLSMDSNEISDLSPLVRLTNLDNMSLRNNQVTDISPLAYLENLVWLDMEGNDITDLSPLDGLRNLGSVLVDK